MYFIAVHKNINKDQIVEVEFNITKIKSILLITFYAKQGAVCYQPNHFRFDDYENICISSYYHYQIRNITINHHVG